MRQSCQLHKCRLQTLFATIKKLSQVRCRNKKRRTKSSFVGTDDRKQRENQARSI